MIAACCVLGLAMAQMVRKSENSRVWPAKTTVATAVATCMIGGLLTVMTWAEGRSANAGILLFFVLGFAGYLLMIGAIISRRSRRFAPIGAGGLMLMLAAVWSWGAALGMYFHRGVQSPSEIACILMPTQGDYTTELRSIWQMRLPEVASQNTSSNGHYIWDYHAILVTQNDGQFQLYNWSKKGMRFDPLDPMRNPYLPRTCPE
ncbi:hypothetical protein EDD53_0721 [Pacificibacter maritimus]|uniref:Uncharacterized protein n=2 Tax=Pacificibacter maritimus TaxID=762213 RepID=A0A3N4V3C2_9RHOB|nr:hypothetical protein EDD53_0721 [Pacificibacter maritimus]